MSSVTTWALENAIETADSMKARGYGVCKRSAFSIFKFDKRDLSALIFMLIMGAYTFVGSVFGTMQFSYFPAIKYEAFSVYNICGFISYFLLCMYPVIFEIMEVKKWNSLKSKI